MVKLKGGGKLPHTDRTSDKDRDGRREASRRASDVAQAVHDYRVRASEQRAAEEEQRRKLEALRRSRAAHGDGAEQVAKRLLGSIEIEGPAARRGAARSEGSLARALRILRRLR